MPTIPLSFFSLLNTSISSYFFSNNNNNNSKTTLIPSESPPSSPPPPPKSIYAMDVAEVRRVFDLFDQNGDGQITKGELTMSLRNMGIFIPETDLAQMINHIDLNGDGCVDGLEFESLYKLIMERDDCDDEQDDENDIMEAFNIFDKNGDGFISVDELRSVLDSLGLSQGRNLEDFKVMIMKVDVDGDGRVSFNEFKKMMKEGGFASFN